MSYAIDVGSWRCVCGRFLDLVTKPEGNVLICRCPKCERRFEVRIEIREIVAVALNDAA